MDVILDSNAAVLENKYPKDYSHMKEMKNVALHVEWVDTRDGSVALTVQKRDGQIRLNSTYQPKREAQKWACQYDYQNLKTNIFMFGMGNGIFVRELLARMQPDARLFLLEPDYEIAYWVFRKMDFSDILSDERVTLLFDDRRTDKFEKRVKEYINYFTISNQIICFHPGYEKLYPEEYLGFLQRMERMTERARVSKNTNARFADKALSNTVLNLKFLRESNYIDEIREAISANGKAAIIVAAGPSLDKNIGELKKAKDRAFIMAVDSVIGRLDAEGISYDCIVSIDPDKKTGVLEEYENWKEVPLFCDIASKYEITSLHRGKKIWYTGAGLLSELYSRQGFTFDGEVHGGGSVATVAFSIAEYLGFGTIILVGQDLAYQGDSSHAGGVREYELKNEEASVRFVDGIDGEQVKSRFDWIFFRDWFEERIAYHKDIRVVDATEGGALIHGSQVCSLAEAIESYCGEECSFRETLINMNPTFDEKYTALRQDLLNMEKEFDNVARKTQEGLGYCQEFLEKGKAMTGKKHDRLLKEIRKANRYIMMQKTACILLDMLTSQLSTINSRTGNPTQDEINSVKYAKAVYDSWHQGADKMKRLFQEERDKL